MMAWRTPTISELATTPERVRQLIRRAKHVAATMRIGRGRDGDHVRFISTTKVFAVRAVDGAFADHQRRPDLYPEPSVTADLSGEWCWLGR